jgi:two-component system C4-dicarboxylate transport sensor histidine kinase DctB
VPESLKLRLPDAKSWLRAVRRRLHYPIVAALTTGILFSLVVVEVLERELESEGRAKMQASLVLIKAKLSVETIRAKGMGVASIMGLTEPVLKEAALGKHKLDDPAVLEPLSIARQHFDYEGLYVIDKTGVMVANETEGKKSTGKSVSFRPYFQQAIQGTESVYMAVGTNSETRGIYYSAPLYAASDERSDIIGVIAIKTSAEFLDRLLQEFGGDSMLISPQGVVYASTRREWRWAMTPPLSEKRIQEIRDLKQFGMRFEQARPSALKFDPYHRDIDVDGERVAAERVTLDMNDPYGEWSLVGLKPASSWFSLQAKLQTAAVICLFALLIGVVLHRQRAFRIHANKKLALETNERKHAENAVLEAAKSSASIAELNAALRSAEDFKELSLHYFSGLAKLIGIRYGVLYVADHANATLKQCGGYGNAMILDGQTINYGYGLVGQCALEQRPIRLDSPPEDYIRIISGTGQAKPSYLLLRPLIQNGMLVGVVELAGLDNMAEQHLDMLQELEPVAAACVNIIDRKQQFHAEFLNQLAFQQALIDSIPNPIFYKGLDTRFLGCNQAYERAFNVQKQDFIGKRVLDLEYLPYGERMAFQKEDEGVIAHQGTVKRMVTLRYADGKLRSCLYWVTAFSLEDGVKGGLVGTFIEIDMEEDDSINGPAAVGQES